MNILLDFGTFTLKAELEHTPVAEAFADNLPYEIDLTGWGRELYGPISRDLGSHNPVGVIPPGGLAYTNKGNYFCIFFGQNPAWEVEYIGNITEDYSALEQMPKKVTVTKE